MLKKLLFRKHKNKIIDKKINFIINLKISNNERSFLNQYYKTCSILNNSWYRLSVIIDIICDDNEYIGITNVRIISASLNKEIISNCFYNEKKIFLTTLYNSSKNENIYLYIKNYNNNLIYNISFKGEIIF